MFFTSAVGDYRQFALPFAFSVLHTNADAAVELMIDDLEAFKRDNAEGLALLDQRRLHLRELDWPVKRAAHARYLLEPHTRSDYVYIADVDILITEPGITDFHIENARRLGLPYSNIVRKQGNRLSGLHFTERRAYYPVITPSLEYFASMRGDEALLYDLVVARGLGLPTGTYRPIHGIHFSPNRTAVMSRALTSRPGPSWGVGEASWRRHKQMVGSDEWKAFERTLSPSYLSLLRYMEGEAAKWLD